MHLSPVAGELEKNESEGVLSKLRNHFKISVFNEETLHEETSFRIFGTSLLVICLGIIALVILLTAGLIAFTPVREYIPGYSSPQTRTDAALALFRADSLEQEILQRDQYLNNIKNILQGKRINVVDSVGTKDPQPQNYSSDNSQADEDFRKEIEAQEQYNLSAEADQALKSVLFFKPIDGVITSDFELNKEHFGIDVAANTGEPIKTILDGTVIFTGWTAETGHVIQVQHANQFVSIYKHSSVLMKKVGDKVKSGEAIAIVGTTGGFSTGPHLHFELWQNGEALNPAEYFDY